MSTPREPLDSKENLEYNLRELFSRMTLACDDESNGRGVNLDAQEIAAEFIEADTDVVLDHNLGRIPGRYIIVKSFMGGSVYDGNAAWTESTISLRSDKALSSFIILVY